MTSQMKRVSLIVIAAVLVVGLSLLGAGVAGVFSGGPPTVHTGTGGGETSQVGGGGGTSQGGGGTVVQSDSIVIGNIVGIVHETSGYPWEVGVMVQSSSSVDSLPNPTADKVGQVITVKTDQDMTGFQAGQIITAHVKYVGDVPSPGITLYMSSIKALTAPTPLPSYQYVPPNPY